MATYVLSDIHGLIYKWHKMLEKINFSKDDTLYIIGDVIDRGQFGIDIYKEIIKKPNIIVLKGNHELMMIETIKKYIEKGCKSQDDLDGFTLDLWLNNGAYPTITSFMLLSKKEQKEIYEYIKKEDDYKFLTVNDKKYLLIHAGLYLHPNYTIEELLEKNIRKEDHLWIREGFLESHQTIPDTTILFGHTMTSYIPEFIWSKDLMNDEQLENCRKHRFYHGNQKIGIDCGCAGNYLLGCLRLDDMMEFYV